jgi:hypothetical protein
MHDYPGHKSNGFAIHHRGLYKHAISWNFSCRKHPYEPAYRSAAGICGVIVGYVFANFKVQLTVSV